MAKQRMINTRFWEDGYTSNLDPIEKLLFLYFLTNTSTNICGFYEIPLKKIASDTGIDRDMVLKIIQRFTDDKKIYYIDGWICIKNFVKHQNQKSPTVRKGIEVELKNIPKNIAEMVETLDSVYSIDTLSHFNLNINSNLNSNSNPKENQKIYPQYNPSNWDIINTMYTYESLDDSGNPLKKVKKKITKQENEMLISVGFLWQEMCSEYLGLDEKEIPMKNLYYPIRATYDRTGFQKEDFKKLFKYFFLDNDIKTESKLSFDLCLSEKYVAKYKLNKKLQAKNSSGTFDIKL
jgi:predicted regulator of amino acid metabolism with ACT domain